MLSERCSRPLECVHSDVWGPCAISSFGGNKWLILFVDDYNQFTWLYLSKSKVVIPALIIQFYKTIKTQFDLNIKSFRIDNMREYMNSIIDTYFKAKVILHESFCVNTLQQNSLEERKIGHVLATT